jgi:hypothetical protein
LSGMFFTTRCARWGGVCLVAALLSIPVAGTALYIVDQYVNPRNLAAFSGIFALTRLLEKKYVRGLAWLIFAGSMHPLMWVFPASFCVLFIVMEFVQRWWKISRTGEAAMSTALFGLTLAPVPSEAYHQAALKHGYHYIQHWAWYEVLGAVAPLILFWWFRRWAGQRWENVGRVSLAFIVYGSIYFLMALVFDLPARFESLARLQPLRSLHFLYIVMFVMIGGFLGEHVLKLRWWRWLILFLPLCAGMFIAQRQLFPASAHVEWPGVAPRNPWAQAFVWISGHTPVDAVFALDPNYMSIAGEDEIGFRCLSERSRLADAVKDNGVVSMFPPLAEQWWAQVQDQSGWADFTKEGFVRLKEKYDVSWIVLRSSAVEVSNGWDCPYHNSVVQVCRVP